MTTKHGLNALFLTTSLLFSGCERKIDPPLRVEGTKPATTQVEPPETVVDNPFKKTASKYIDVRGSEADPLYRALNFSGKYNGEKFGEVRFNERPARVRIDVHGQNSFKFIVIEEGSIAISTCNGTSIETLILTPAGELTKTIEAWNSSTGVGKVLSQVRISDPELNEQIRDTAGAVQDALKEIASKKKIDSLPRVPSP